MLRWSSPPGGPLRRAAARALATSLAMVAIAGCTKVGTAGVGGAHNASTQPHVLRVGNLCDMSTLNPLLATSLTLQWASTLTLAYLFRYDHQNQPVPELAVAVPTLRNGGIGRDGRTIVYHLRRGAKWSDGAPFDADDVVFTTRVILDPKTNVTSREGWDDIASLDEPDKYTVVFHLREPYSPFLATFFSTGGGGPAVLPKHLLAKTADINKDPYNALPVGIGPFRYVAWKRGDRVEMEANPNYWRGMPKLQRIDFVAIPNRDTLVAQLQTGDLDLWPVAAAAYYPRLLALHNLRVLRQPSYGFGHLDFNLTHPALRDPVVRRALRLAIDRRELRDVVSHGVGILQDGPISPASPYYDPRIGFVPYDIGKANALLDAGGWVRGPDGVRSKNGLRLSLVLVSNAGSPDTDTRIELIRSSWKKIGVEFIRKNVDPQLLLAPYQDGGTIQTGKFDAVVFAWFNDASNDLAPIYSCSQIPPKGQNDLHWCNPIAEAAMQDFKRTYDLGRQQHDDNVVQEELVRDVPTIVMNIQEDLYAYNSDLTGFRPNQVSAFDDMMNVDI
jgi:peptide/nickel transport system substrate-binding protein